MPVLLAGIDARGGARGQRDFNRATTGIVNDARRTDREIDKLDRSMNKLGRTTSATSRRGRREFRGASTGIQRDARNMIASIDQTNKSLFTLSSGFVAFTAIGAAVAIGAIGAAFISTADAMTLVNARLQLVTETTQELTALNANLFDLAQETRQQFLGLVDVYGRFARSTRDLSLEEGALLESTELISKSIVVSGATATEANAALIQLSQGFAAGALRGDEFRSVSEQIPAVLTSVSDGLGITRGELRALAFAGGLTAEKFFKGLSNSAADIRADFEEIPLTVDQSLTQLGNSVSRSVAEIDRATGATSGLAAGIRDLSKAIDSLSTLPVPDPIGLAEQRVERAREVGESPFAQALRAQAESILDPVARQNFLDEVDANNRRFEAELERLLDEARTRRDNIIAGEGPAPITIETLGTQLPKKKSDIPDKDFAKLLEQSERAAKAVAKAEKEAADEIERSRLRSARVIEQVEERLQRQRDDRLEALQEIREREQALADQITERNLTATEQYTRGLAELKSVQDQLTDEEFRREFERLGKQLQEADPLFQSITGRAEQFGSAVASALAAAATGTQSWNQSLRAVLQTLVDIALQVALDETIRAIFKGVAQVVTSAGTADSDPTGSVNRGPTDQSTSPDAQANLVQASRDARTSSANVVPQSIEINVFGAPSQDATSQVVQADQDRVRVDIFLGEVVDSINDDGVVGRAISNKFDIERNRKDV